VFTGRITEVGDVIDVAADRITVRAAKAAASLYPGASIAVSGVCLTATAAQADSFEATVSAETRRRSMLGELRAGGVVNLELPLRVGDPLDGHLVQGHVDAVGKVTRIDDDGIGRRLWVRPPARLLEDLVAKGSIALDGVSLTVAEVARDRFSVALIPTTLAETTLAAAILEQRVNLESDLVGKLARRHGPETASTLAAVVSSLPWAGHLSGRKGVEKAVSQLAAGAAIVVWDPTREGEADVVLAAARLRPEAVRFLLTQACGHTTVPCDLPRLHRLQIPALPGAGDNQATAPHLPVDLASSAGTGVSAPDRASTIRRLAHPDARPEDFVRPRHVFPLGGRPGGLGERAGHTEAALALCAAAGLPTVAAITEIMGPDGTMAGADEAERFALRWGLPLVEIGDLGTWL
jgi:3,4-dihydroxy 2-butanone 4-phosphate synthase